VTYECKSVLKLLSFSRNRRMSKCNWIRTNQAPFFNLIARYSESNTNGKSSVPSNGLKAVLIFYHGKAKQNSAWWLPSLVSFCYKEVGCGRRLERVVRGRMEQTKHVRAAWRAQKSCIARTQQLLLRSLPITTAVKITPSQLDAIERLQRQHWKHNCNGGKMSLRRSEIALQFATGRQLNVSETKNFSKWAEFNISEFVLWMCVPRCFLKNNFKLHRARLIKRVLKSQFRNEITKPGLIKAISEQKYLLQAGITDFPYEKTQNHTYHYSTKLQLKCQIFPRNQKQLPLFTRLIS
jgi:hypothetical protein